MTRKIAEDTPRTLLVALGAWAIAAVVAVLEGPFAKLSMAESGVFSPSGHHSGPGPWPPRNP